MYTMCDIVLSLDEQEIDILRPTYLRPKVGVHLFEPHFIPRSPSSY